MKKVVLISCVSKKVNYPAPAKDLYNSPLFKKSYAYAVSLVPDRIFILSAKYGLVESHQTIAPYDLTLNSLDAQEIQEWSQMVIEKLKSLTDIENDKFIFLAGEKYRRYLLPCVSNYEIPLLGLKIGEQLSWLTRRTQ
ncbi:MAG: hypothetical protein ISS71_07920 [Phycisphaerae bacterium]|nr:hypothetical protein [Phycisphaerae bacterium]